MKDDVKIYDKIDMNKKFTILLFIKVSTFSIKTIYFTLQTLLLTFIKSKKH